MKPSATPWPTNKSFLRSPQTLRSPPNRPPSSPSPSRTKPTAFGRKTAFAVANPSENSSTLAEKACTRPLPTPLSSRTYRVNAEAIIHRNQVAFNSNRALFVPVIARQIRARFLHIREVNARFKRLNDHWNALHRIDDDASAGNRGWKEDLENKRDKRSQREIPAVFQA